MTKREIILKIEELLADAGCGVLATVSDEGSPRIRWMTPTIIQEDANLIYAVSSMEFKKARDLERNANASWMFQKKDLREVVNITGKINMIDNPSLKSRIIEKIGNKLHVFWKINEDPSNFIVLETVISEAVYFDPVKNITEKVVF